MVGTQRRVGRVLVLNGLPAKQRVAVVVITPDGGGRGGEQHEEQGRQDRRGGGGADTHRPIVRGQRSHQAGEA
jgi:hypothetical protein